MEVDAPPAAKVADAPFNDIQSSDIVLRSCGENAVDFYTQKAFLVHASPVFKDMFSLPQDDQSKTSETPSIVATHETVEDLRTLLLWCNPGTIPATPTSTNQWYRHYILADKYLLDIVKAVYRKSLVSFLRESPAGVYTISRQFGWKEEAKLAAEETLSYPIHKLVCETDSIPQDLPARFLQDLLKYHHQCSTALSDFMSLDHWIMDWYSYGGVDYKDDRLKPFFLKGPKTGCCKSRRHDPWEDGASVPYTLVWWENFVKGCSASLAMIPDVEKIPLLELMCKATTKAAKCEKCGPIAPERLMDFFAEAKESIRRDHVIGVRCPSSRNS